MTADGYADATIYWDAVRGEISRAGRALIRLIRFPLLSPCPFRLRECAVLQHFRFQRFCGALRRLCPADLS